MKSKNWMKMIFRSSLLISVLGSLYFLTPLLKGKNPINPDKEALILQGLMQTIEYVHMSPKKVDDEMSKNVYNKFLERIDGQKRFLIQGEVEKLKPFETKIDDQINARTFEFFNASLPLVDNGIKRAKLLVNEILDSQIDYNNQSGKYESDVEKRSYAKDEKQLREMWKQMLVFEVMSEWTDKLDDQEDESYKGEKKTESELQAQAVRTIKKRFNDWFDRLQKLRRSDRLESYLGTIANYFDPHTDYFSPKDKQDFDINMGGKLEGIGARLVSDGDYTKVASIIVGGPAWKTKKLNDEDIILKVAQKGQEPVDIIGMVVDDVVQLVRGKKGTRVILTVKKKDGTIADIEIERDEVQIEDSKAKSVLLNMTDKVHNIGYIYLPKFYSEFEDGGNSCARDVADEIKKLKSENVNGIILDLRNNSGGSLSDVVDMSGLFIEQGPIVQVKGKESKPFLHEDKDPGVLYDGPLIIMVNHFSASASEIIAAAMQDYGRAIIVGSKSTFGKGTVQRFFDLDRGIRGFDELKPLGSVKMTTQKFYRVNGGSTQLKGVIPDIILPDTYQYIDTGEKEYDNSMVWTEISPVPYSQNVVKINNKDKIKSMSQERINASNNFKLVTEGASIIKSNRDMTQYPLKLNDYRAMIEKRNLESKKYDNMIKKEIVGLKISNLPQDMSKINLDEKNRVLNDNFINDLKKDIYLEETLYIIRDMIMSETSFAVQQKKIASPIK
jgi:carboxyl-terminal processing protease